MVWHGLVAYDAFTDKMVCEVQLDDGSLLDLLEACSMTMKDLDRGIRIVPKHIAEAAVISVGGSLPMAVDWFVETMDV